MKLGSFRGAVFMAAASLATLAAFAPAPGRPAPTHRAAAKKTVKPAKTPAPAPQKAPAPAPASPQIKAGPGALELPANPQFFGSSDPGVRKATAIINGYVLTGTDVDHRLALFLSANEGKVTPEELQRAREQVLRNLVDETLEIQAAEAKGIKVTQKEIDDYYVRVAQSNKKTTKEFSDYLRSIGSSEASIKRQIHGEMAWQRLQSQRIEPFVNVSGDEVKSILARLNASKGAAEYRVSEIFLAATPENSATVRASADQIVQQLRGGGSFLAYARQFSQASTAAVGGDLGWVRPEQLPETLSQAVRSLPVGTVSDPIPVSGGFSIVAVADSRKVLTSDPRDAVLALKQISINFAENTPRAEAEPKIQALTRLSQSLGGCGRAEEEAAKIGAEVVSRDQLPVRELPPALQDIMLKLNVGQATSPFGSLQQGVRILVLCGRDDPPAAGLPSYDQVYSQLAEQRMAQRAQRYLRDLRSDAVIEYR